MTRCLIDGDIIAYRCAASIEPTKIKPEREPHDLAIQRLDELTYRILEATGSDSYKVFLSGSENYRKILEPTYKANRVQPKPAALDACRQFLLSEWNAVVCAGYEADDGIGIEYKEGDVIASIDKDLKQIPAEHYNFVKDVFEVVDDDTADLYFWTQMLVGDASDNVRGVEGIGPVKAQRILSGILSWERPLTVENLYPNRGDFLRTLRLLKILRSQSDYENILREIQGEKPPEASGPEDTGVLSEAHQE